MSSPFNYPSSCEESEFALRDGVMHCNFCGSLHVSEAIKMLKKPGVHFSGSDWKYGWPHKFYIGNHLKFYNNHLKTATDEELAEFDRLSRKCFGIAWGRDEKGVKYQAPRNTSTYGWQLDGIIGADGEPSFSEFCKVDKVALAGFMEAAFKEA